MEKCEEEEPCGDEGAVVLPTLSIEWALLATAVMHLLLCPYTKVEESFNMQAIHDIIYHRTDIAQYDHLEFPGAVPRTFVGPLVVAALSAPLALVVDKFTVQLIVRALLAISSVLAFYRFRQSVESVFGRQVAIWLVCVTVTQFHFMFYMSRTLPNMMAVPLVLVAVASWMRQQHASFICWSAAAILLFRSELAGLLGILLLMEIVSGRLGLLRCVKLSSAAGAVLLLLTVSVDSLLWRRLVWPEAEVFAFNVLRNKSSDWGTSPLLWYWYSALPRAMAASLPLVAVGMWMDRRVRLLAGPALAFVALYSLLPHKELRFIIYVVPLLNVATARACHGIWEGRLKSSWRAYLATAACCHLLVNCAVTAILVTVARHNYPGGAALARLEQLESGPAYLHLDEYTAQTGVTRFLHGRHHWRYNKTENLAAGSAEMQTFSHLMVEARSKRSASLKPYLHTHTILDSVDVFSHVQFNYGHFPPLRLRMRPAIFILANNVESNIKWPLLPDDGDIYPQQDAAEINMDAAAIDVSETVVSDDVEQGTNTALDLEVFPDEVSTSTVIGADGKPATHREPRLSGDDDDDISDEEGLPLVR